MLIRSYLVIPGFYDADETREMLDRAHQLLDDFDPTHHPMVRRACFYVPTAPRLTLDDVQDLCRWRACRRRLFPKLGGQGKSTVVDDDDTH